MLCARDRVDIKEISKGLKDIRRRGAGRRSGTRLYAAFCYPLNHERSLGTDQGHYTHMRLAYLRKPATPDPTGPNRFSIGFTTYVVQGIQHLPSIPELTEEHVFPVKFGQLRFVIGENDEELRRVGVLARVCHRQGSLFELGFEPSLVVVELASVNRLVGECERGLGFLPRDGPLPRFHPLV